MKELLFILLLAGIAWTLWRAHARKPLSAARVSEPGPTADPQLQHIRSALQFATAQRDLLARKQREEDAWRQEYAHAKVSELDRLSGEKFEEFLAGLFRTQGYSVELTAVTGDYGADLILAKDRQRIAVQAKRYSGSVGVQAVQEALSGRAYYQCNCAWVVSTGTFTPNAKELAGRSGVKLMDRSAMAKLIAQYAKNAATA